MSDVDGSTVVLKTVRPRVSSKVSPKSSSVSIEEKSKKCSILCCKSSSSFDKELIQILSERKPKKSLDSDSNIDNIYNIYKNKKDGCSETGYLQKRYVQPSYLWTLDRFRKTCPATRNLPSPRAAIRMSNLKQPETLQPSRSTMSKEETCVSEINQMLVDRLSGSVIMDDDSPSEVGEALISYQHIRRDFEPIILSQLINEQDTQRMSISYEIDKNRRTSSFSLKRNSELGTSFLQNDFVKLSSKQSMLSDSSDADFINQLPKISKMVKNELELNLSDSQRYVKRLKTVFKQSKFADQASKRKTTEHWMVILYTTSEENPNTLTDFNCNLVRLILQHHCVTYDERDIALKRHEYKKELQYILKTDSVIVPYVYGKGVSIGDVQIIFVMHKMKMMNEILKDFIIAPEVYVNWLYKRSKSKSPITINVKLSGFPALRQLITKRQRTLLMYRDNIVIKTCKSVIKRARSEWQRLSKEMYTQPRLLKLILLRNTIIICYSILNKIYWDYLPGRKSLSVCYVACPFLQKHLL